MIFEKIAEVTSIIGIMWVGYILGRIIESLTIGSFTNKKSDKNGDKNKDNRG